VCAFLLFPEPFPGRSYASLNFDQEKGDQESDKIKPIRTKLRFVRAREKPKAKHPCFNPWWQHFVTIKFKHPARFKKPSKKV
jgi:hypothetical protein